MEIESLLELEDITLLPSGTNKGWPDSRKINYTISDSDEVTGIRKSLPIFTSPMEAIVNNQNWKIWQDSGIKPILPRTEDLNLRLQACGFIFSAFSLHEVQSCFIDTDRRGGNNQYHICIDSGNGHDTSILTIALTLKRLYGKQVILMGGNIANPYTYLEYSKAGFDYVRVGMTSGSLVNREKFGFHYPMASLLMDIQMLWRTGGIGLKYVKIIADGGITCYSDIMKAIALGADYVMIGKEFASVYEAAGTLYHNQVDKNTGNKSLEKFICPKDIPSDEVLSTLSLVRLYQGNTTLEMQALREGFSCVEEWRAAMPERNWKINNSDSSSSWVKVKTTLLQWVEEFKSCVRFSFMMSDSINWKEYKEKIKYGKL